MKSLKTRKPMKIRDGFGESSFRKNYSQLPKSVNRVSTVKNEWHSEFDFSDYNFSSTAIGPIASIKTEPLKRRRGIGSEPKRRNKVHIIEGVLT